MEHSLQFHTLFLYDFFPHSFDNSKVFFFNLHYFSVCPNAFLSSLTCPAAGTSNVFRFIYFFKTRQGPRKLCNTPKLSIS